jgi:competence protein ComGC
MEEMLKVKDIPTVDRVKQSIDLVGEKEFERMVNAQYSKYKPSDVDQEAMLVESVTLDILGKAQRSPYPQQAALDLAQQRAALPVEQGGLGLLATNTAADRAKAMGFDVDAYHSTNASDITKFDLGKSIRGEGTSVALTPENAQAYGNITYPLKIDQQKIFDPTNKDQFKELKNYVENLIQQQKPYDKDALSFYPFTSKKVLENLSNPQTGAYYLENEIISKSLKDLGYSGSIGMESGQSQLKIFDPDKIRSRFAAFDPFRKDVATATAMGVALPDLLAAEKEDKQKKLSKALTK